MIDILDGRMGVLPEQRAEARKAGIRVVRWTIGLTTLAGGCLTAFQFGQQLSAFLG